MLPKLFQGWAGCVPASSLCCAAVARLFLVPEVEQASLSAVTSVICALRNAELHSTTRATQRGGITSHGQLLNWVLITSVAWRENQRAEEGLLKQLRCGSTRGCSNVKVTRTCWLGYGKLLESIC